MSRSVVWEGTIDNLDYEREAVARAGIDASSWPARVEREDNRVRLVIAADGVDDYSQAVRPLRCRDASPSMSPELIAELVAAGELNE